MINDSPTAARARSIVNGAASTQLGLAVIIAVFWAAFVLVSPRFVSPFNLFAIGRALSVDILIGFAQMATLATGGVNLSVGSIGVCAAMFGGYLMQTLGLPAPLAMVGALALGVALGGLNGAAIALTGVNSFVITLASSHLYSGAMLVLTQGRTFNRLPPEIATFGNMRLFSFVSPLLLVALAMGLALSALYGRTLLGRQILAAGANPSAATMSGVSIARMVTISHALSGGLAAMGGAMVVARLGAAFPAIGGDEWLLPSFLGPVLGGVPLGGGAVSVLGAVLGELLVSTVRGGLLLLQIGAFWLPFYLGAILLFAVVFNRYLAASAERRRLFAS